MDFEIIILDSSGNICYSSSSVNTSSSLKYMPLMATQNVCSEILEQKNGISLISTSHRTIYVSMYGNCNYLVVTPRKSRRDIYGSKGIIQFKYRMYMEIIHEYLLFLFGQTLDSMIDSFSQRQAMNLPAIMRDLNSVLIKQLFSNTCCFPSILKTCELLQISPDLRLFCKQSLTNALLNAFPSSSVDTNGKLLNKIPDHVMLILFVGNKLASIGSSSTFNPDPTMIFLLNLYQQQLKSDARELEHCRIFSPSSDEDHDVYVQEIGDDILLVGLFHGSLSFTGDQFSKLFEYLMRETKVFDYEIMEFLKLRASSHVSMLPYLAHYPGLVYFICKDQKTGVSIVPKPEGLWRETDTSAKSIEEEEKREYVQMIRTSLFETVQKSQYPNANIVTVQNKSCRVLYKRYASMELWSVWMNLIPLQYAETHSDRLAKNLEIMT